jgi:hypothetical protein
MGQDATGRDERQRVRVLIATGITPDRALSDRARAALDRLVAQPAKVVEDLLTLIHESKVPIETPPRSDRLHYPSPRLKARKPSEFPPGRPSH